MRYFNGRLFFALAVIAALIPGVCLASRWVEVGNTGASLDKVMVDADSLQKLDQFTIVDIMTLYSAPRVNDHNIKLDRHVQRTAIDCAKRTFIGIMTIGYLGDKRVGSSAQTADWRIKTVPLGSDAMSNRIYALVCKTSASAAAPGTQQGTGARIITGSGIVLDRLGHVLTAAHVVSRCKSIAVKQFDATPVTSVVEAVDGKDDLAVLKTNNDTPVGKAARFREQSVPVQLGETIGVVGFPLFGILSSDPKATFGQVNSVAGIGNDYTRLQISAPLQPGNSGGAVLDSSGLVIGVVESGASLGMVAVTGNLPQNINFATRGEVAQLFLAAQGIHIQTAKPHRPMKTEAIAADGEQSAVLIACLAG